MRRILAPIIALARAIASLPLLIGFYLVGLSHIREQRARRKANKNER